MSAWTIIPALLSCMALAGAGVVAGAPWKVEVFTDHAHPVSRAETVPEVVVYHLDGLVLGAAQLSENLSRDEREALAAARQRLKANSGLRARMLESGKALAQAHFVYGLDRYPAVVIDGAYVIYGVTDLARVRQLYTHWRKREGP